MAKRNLIESSSPALEGPTVVRRAAPARDPGGAAGNRFFEVLCKWNVLLLCLLLFGLMVWVYLPSLRGEFIDFDERVYLTEDAHVKSGLSLENVAWAFGSLEASNWHPLTWLSHMLDCQLYGLKPWGHHLSSVLLHGVNTVLVFLVLFGLTGARWRSLMVAVLFGVHPQRVESVAWISERKDVLSALFWLLTLWAYTRYAQKEAEDQRRVSGVESITSPSVVSPLIRHWPHFYGLALVFFGLGLMSKTMVMTLPFVMLLLDWWPLDRVLSPGPGVSSSSTLKRLLLEKAPFFVLAAVVSGVTYLAQRGGGMMREWAGLPLGARAGNALISYVRYLGKLFWPVKLSVFYPHPGYWPVATVLFCGLLLLGVTIGVWAVRWQRPYLLVGWLWYVGTLMPVIGLVQIGGQSMADRYTYVPMMGVMIVLVWGVHGLTQGWRYRVIGLSATGVAVSVICIGLTREQMGYWQDGVTVWNHAIAVTQDNYDAHNRLGDILDRQGRLGEAFAHYQEAIRLNPNFAEARNNLGAALMRQGRLEEALNQYREAVRLNPEYDQAHNNLGVALSAQGRLDEAVHEFEEAVKLNPNWADAHSDLGSALGSQGRLDEAIAHLQKALEIDSHNAGAHNNLGIALVMKGRTDAAISQFQEAVRLNPEWAGAHANLGSVLCGQGRLDEALVHLHRVLEINPQNAEAHNNLGIALVMKGKTDAAISQFQEAIRLNPESPGAHRNLGSEWVRTGRIEAAIAEFQQALRLKPDDAESRSNLAAALRAREDPNKQPTTSTKP